MINKICEALVKETVKVKKEGFFAEDQLNFSDLFIEVEGIGQLNFPISQEDAKKLLDISSKAKVGIREKTVLDTKIRDTNEIRKDKLSIKFKDDALTSTLTDMGKLMELSDDMKLVPHLHNMLIYTPGQFFKPHQDTEKLEGMVATLIIVLPSPHIGGNLIINHHKQNYNFSSENIDSKKIKCIAFYADCYHEVKEVTHGYRIALTYNLVLESTRKKEDGPINDNLVQAIKDYFHSKTTEEHEPEKLVYFLDHNYTEHGLKWNMMKGTDRQNAASFYSAAKKLDLVPYLALVEVHKTWNAFNEYEDYKYKNVEIIGSMIKKIWRKKK